ncbi:MAG: hypothetical protein AVDCRST_MAG80-1837 [uncultured Rubrobacteraceae bacterium]|uniref:Uncharacterized protein n=1 Tax=uncultured Rubrobacteraceae bacterium TaxID=349277 RepID=A0A6J4QQN1_9ACTN|nr:MAG: hypothetical protein AVDCRST_MAG80-1837 [uncultured Rubrobacteraceae bacterium]
MNLFTSWDVLGISLVLSLRFLGPFALGVSVIAWTTLRPPRDGATRRRGSLLLGVALGLLVCLAPVVLFLATDVFG